MPRRRDWLVTLVLGAAGGFVVRAQGAEVAVALSGILGRKALLVIDGGAPRALAVGESHGGVRLVEIGADRHGFAFDNERPRHTAYIPAVELRSTPVTCGEFLAFVDDGGYARHDLWLADGWATVQAEGWTAPLYWRHGDAGWEVFTLGGWQPLVADEPVCHVSYYEADAFARWAGCRLPTEFEWEALAAGDDPAAGNGLPFGSYAGGSRAVDRPRGHPRRGGRQG